MFNIVLIGMPGCGKSTIGLELAKISGMPVFDTDFEIVKNFNEARAAVSTINKARAALNMINKARAAVSTINLSIPDIFAKFGEPEFRRLESIEIKKTGKLSGHIVITGGGVVKDFDNYKYLHENGRIYHIERDLNLLEREGRPLSINANIENMYRERLPLYQKFRDAVIYNDKMPRDAALEILNDFNKENIRR